jgi:hypothetical protein
MRFFNQNSHWIYISSFAWHLVAGTLPLPLVAPTFYFRLIKTKPQPLELMGWGRIESAGWRKA